MTTLSDMVWLSRGIRKTRRAFVPRWVVQTYKEAFERVHRQEMERQRQLAVWADDGGRHA